MVMARRLLSARLDCAAIPDAADADAMGPERGMNIDAGKHRRSAAVMSNDQNGSA
jgi:hypothetical protein